MSQPLAKFSAGDIVDIVGSRPIQNVTVTCVRWFIDEIFRVPGGGRSNPYTGYMYLTCSTGNAWVQEQSLKPRNPPEEPAFTQFKQCLDLTRQKVPELV